MRTEPMHRDESFLTRARSKGDRVNRIKLALGLVMSLALLSNQACDRPPGESSSSTMATLSRLVDRGLALVTPPSSTFTLQIDSAAAVPPGQQFRVVVSYRDPTGHLMNVPTPVTLKLNPNTAGGTLTGDLKRVPVNGVATFDGLAVDKVGDGYTLMASAVKVPDATSRAFSVAYSVVAPPQPVGSSPATAQPISPDVPVLGTLLPGHVDYYVFHARVGDLLTVSSYSNRIDIANWDTSLRLRLIAPDGTTEIARSGATSADADGVDNGFSLLRAPQEGDYYLACDVDE